MSVEKGTNDFINHTVLVGMAQRSFVYFPLQMCILKPKSFIRGDMCIENTDDLGYRKDFEILALTMMLPLPSTMRTCKSLNKRENE